MKCIVLVLLLLVTNAESKCTCPLKSVEKEIEELSLGPEVTGEVVYDKRLVVRNSCSFDVALGVTGAFAGKEEEGKCGPNRLVNHNGGCFYSLEDAPSTLAQGEEWSVELSTPEDRVWSGHVWGVKPEFYESVCSNTDCPPWVGPIGAVTKAEFTLSKAGMDYYDVSAIDGVNIPLSLASADGDEGKNHFNSGTAGDCRWSYEPGEFERYMVIVEEEGDDCFMAEECPEGEVCGSFFEPWKKVQVGRCGKHGGYASALLHCASGSTGEPFFCEDYAKVINCSGDYGLSGFSQPPGTKVCGCVDKEGFEALGLKVNADGGMKCKTTDPVWEERSWPFLRFLVEGCADTYTWAYQDTSTFFSTSTKEYAVEFCPGDSERTFYV